MTGFVLARSGEAVVRCVSRRKAIAVALFATSALVGAQAAYAAPLANPDQSVGEAPRAERDLRQTADPTLLEATMSETTVGEDKGSDIVVVLPVPHAPTDRIYWDGSNPGLRNNNVIDGGNGTWHVGGFNFTDAAGAVNGDLDPSSAIAIFAGTAGVVTIDSNSGQVQAGGLRFDTSGYRLAGSTSIPLTLTGAPTIQVGDYTVAGAGITATIDTDLSSASLITKTGAGTLIFARLITLPAGLTIDAGTVQFNGSTNAFQLVNNGSLIFNQPAGSSGGSIQSVNVSGTGSIAKTGPGTVTIRGSITSSGIFTISEGSLAIESTANITTSIINNAALYFDSPNTILHSGNIIGPGVIENTGLGRTVLTGDVSLGSFFVRRGTLQIGNGGTTGTLTGNIVVGNSPVGLQDNTNLIFNRSDQHTFAGNISGTGALAQAGTGTLILTGNATHARGTTISAGTLQIGNGGTTGSIQGTITNNSILSFNRSDTVTLSTGYFGTGTLVQAGTGTLSLDNFAFNGSNIQVSAGILRIGLTSGSSFTANILNNASVVFDRPSAHNYAVNIFGSGTVTKLNTNTLLLSGSIASIGDLTISAGALWIGLGGTTATSGSVSTNIINNANLTFARADNTTFANSITGTGTTVKREASVLTLTGNSSAFAGITNVNTGSLTVNGPLGSSAHRLNVASGARLGGTGQIGGLTTVNNGGILLGTQGGTLGFTNLTLNSASNINVALGAPGTQALFDVSGNLTLDGVLNITDAGGFGPGLYRLFNYGETLIDNGLSIGTIPGGVGASDLSIQTSVANQINLIRSAGIELLFWDGGNAAQWDNGAINGGSGTWTATSRTWTDSTGAQNGPMIPVPGFAVFAGAAGTVTADNSAGNLSVSGMQFATSGYVLNGGPIALAGAGDAVIRVGDGTAAGASFIATISSALTGTVGLNKTDLGTLILSGANSYTGATTLSAGTLRLTGDDRLSSQTALTVASGATFDIRGTIQRSGSLSGGGSILSDTRLVTGANNASTTFSGTISDGQLIKTGTGNLTLSGTSNLSALSVEGGRLTIAGAGNVVTGPAGVQSSTELFNAGSLTGNVNIADGSVLDNSGTITGRVVSGGGSNVTNSGTITAGLTNNGGTVVNSGTISSFAMNNTGTFTSTGIINGQFSNGGTANLRGQVNGLLTNGGSLTLTGATTGVTRFSQTNGATLNLNNFDFAAGEINGAGSIQLGTGGLTIGSSNVASSFNGVISGSGGLTKVGTNILTLYAENTYTGTTTISGGTLQIGLSGTTGSVAGHIVNNGALIFDRSNGYQYAGNISGTGTVTQSGTGLLTLTGNVTTSGVFTANGAVQIGNGGITGSIAANIVNNGGLTFNRSNDLTYAAAMSGAGGFTKTGAGTLTLSGSNGSYAGTANVNAGGLVVTGSLGTAASRLNVLSGARLSGTGQIGGLTTIADGGILAGSQGSTLTFANLTLSNASIISATLGAPGTTALFNVTGNLGLDGVLNVSDMGGFGGPGVYRLFTYGGTLTNNGLAIGTLPAGANAADLSIQTAVANQVNLVNTNGVDLLFWDGGNSALYNNGAVDGGTGAWTATSPTWTTANGALNAAMKPAPGFAIFSGTAGTVTVDNNAGAVSALGMQFATSGYVLNGGPLTLAGAGGDSIIRVGDGSASGASSTATINAALTGATRLVKTDLGTLILAGANTYSGNTTVSAGTLQIGNGGTSGSLTGLVDVASGATLAFNRSDALTYAGAISGGGALVQRGAGTLTLTSDSTHAGGTTIASGTLQIGNGGTTGTIAGNVVDNGALIFNRSNDFTFAGNISGTGTVTHAGTGTLTLTGVTSVGGQFTTNGALRIGDGGTAGSIAGNIANNASVTFNRSDGLTYDGNMSGTGSVIKLGAGTLTLTAANSYSGGTSVNAGILQIGAGGTTGSIAGDVLVNTMLRFNRSDALAYADILTGAGTLNQAGAGALTLTGNSGGFTGATSVTAGTLRVNGTLGTGASSVNVASGASLGGSGTIGGAVTLANGGRLVGLFGNTLTMGSLSLSSGSFIDISLGAPSTQALFAVNDNLTLDGTLNISDGGGMGPGLYRLFNYTGTLTNNGLDIGSLPGGYVAGDITVQTSVANQVNLLNTRNVVLNFWDGGAVANRNNGVIDGGTGTWTGTSLTWTDATGLTNGALRPTPGFAIFSGASGTVTASGTPQELSVTGMQFATNGYELRGDAVTLAGDGGQSIIRVGDGTAAGSNMTATISAVLTGTGSLVKSDLGNLILTGANTYSGNTIVQAGTLTGNAASIRGNVSNSGIVVFNQGSAATFSGTISGTGSFVKTGAGVLTLSGASSSPWSVNQGELVSTSQLFGGNLNIASGATFTFNQSANGQYAGTLAGAGAFRVLGGGMVTLTGNSTGYTGTTTVSAGTLSVNGILPGQLNIGAGGRLMGTGTVGTTSLSGTIAPGNSIGTLTINGNFTFASGAIYEVEVNPQGQSDRIVVTGTATIGGGSVVSLASGGTYAPLTDYVILTAGGGVTGTFGTVSSNLAFLTPTLSYAANSVTLRLTRNDIDFSAQAANANQASVANAIESQGFGQTLYNQVLVLSGADSRTAFAQLAGDGHASLQSNVIEDSRFMREALLDRGSVEGEGTAVWGRLTGSWSSTDGDGNAAGYDRDAAGATTGIDTSLGEDWRLGVGIAYLDSDLDTDGGFGAKVETLQIGSYLTGRLGRVSVGLGAAYGAHDVTTSRTVIFPGFTGAPSGSYDLSSLQAFGEVGFRLVEGRTNVEPFVQIAHVSVSSDAFVETGDAAALRSADVDSDATIGTLGLRTDTRFGGDDAGVSLRGMAGVRHVLSGGEPVSVFSFDTGSAFTITGNRLDETVFVGEAGIDIALSERARIGVSYSGRIGERVEDHGAKATLSLRF